MQKVGILGHQVDSESTIQLKSKRPFTQRIAVKSNLVAYLLWFLGGFGVLGIHRFYLGRWVSGLLWLLTGGLFFIGAIIDLFLIPEMVRVENLAGHLLRSTVRHELDRMPAPQTST